MRRVALALAYTAAALLIAWLTPKPFELHGPFTTSTSGTAAHSENLVAELSGPPLTTPVLLSPAGLPFPIDDDELVVAFPLQVTTRHEPLEYLGLRLRVDEALYYPDLRIDGTYFTLGARAQPRIWTHLAAAFVVPRDWIGDGTRLVLQVQDDGPEHNSFVERVEFRLNGADLQSVPEFTLPAFEVGGVIQP